MKRYYLSDHLLSLGDLPMHQKMLHMILWERADPVGWVKLNLELFSGIAGRYAFSHDDVDALKPMVYRKSHDKVFLTNFFITQQSTLSTKSKGNSKIWSAMWEHWKATPEHPEPYLSFMRNEIKLPHLIPDMPEEFHGGPDDVKPKWLENHLLRVQRSIEYPVPDWPENVVIAYRAMLDNFAEIAKDVSSKDKADKFRLTVNMVDNVQKQIQSILNEEEPDIVEQQIRSALNKNVINVFKPMNPWKSKK